MSPPTPAIRICPDLMQVYPDDAAPPCPRTSERNRFVGGIPNRPPYRSAVWSRIPTRQHDREALPYSGFARPVTFATRRPRPARPNGVGTKRFFAGIVRAPLDNARGSGRRCPANPDFAVDEMRRCNAPYRDSLASRSQRAGRGTELADPSPDRFFRRRRLHSAAGPGPTRSDQDSLARLTGWDRSALPERRRMPSRRHWLAALSPVCAIPPTAVRICRRRGGACRPIALTRAIIAGTTADPQPPAACKPIVVRTLDRATPLCAAGGHRVFGADHIVSDPTPPSRRCRIPSTTSWGTYPDVGQQMPPIWRNLAQFPGSRRGPTILCWPATDETTWHPCCAGRLLSPTSRRGRRIRPLGPSTMPPNGANPTTFTARPPIIEIYWLETSPGAVTLWTNSHPTYGGMGRHQ